MAYLNYKGIPFPTMIYSAEKLKYVENEFQLLDDDVVTSTYPKSGTNWMLEILGLIQYDGDPSWVHSVLSWDRSPWIETVETAQSLLNNPSPRFLTTHLPFQLFPKSFLHSKAKIIYVIRNPKDVLVSYYHFFAFFKGYEERGTMEEFMTKFLNGHVPFGSWFDHVRGWMEMKDQPNFFFITYEELQQKRQESVMRICRFLGKELTSQQIDSVVENTSFQKMKDNNMSNYTQGAEEYFDHKNGKLMRKGISGDWKNHLTVAQSEYFDRVYQEKMQGINLTFPWD